VLVARLNHHSDNHNTMATNHDHDHAVDCDDFEISSDLHIECAKGDLHNALGMHEEAVEDSVASSPTSDNKRATTI
jgi:hypothetical protein